MMQNDSGDFRNAICSREVSPFFAVANGTLSIWCNPGRALRVLDALAHIEPLARL